MDKQESRVLVELITNCFREVWDEFRRDHRWAANELIEVRKLAEDRHYELEGQVAALERKLETAFWLRENTERLQDLKK
jgi:hypothetical protein